VTAQLDGSIVFDIHANVEMEPIGCEANGCHGHGACGCRPRFAFQADAARAEIVVDSITHSIFRPAGGSGRWVLPGPII
jgi:hypothetical protein